MTRKEDKSKRLEGRVAELEGRVAGLEAATQQRLARLEAAFEALWHKVDKLEDEKKKKKKGGEDEEEEEDDEDDDDEEDDEDDDDEEDDEDDDDEENEEDDENEEEEDDYDDAEDQDKEGEKKTKKENEKKRKSSQIEVEGRDENKKAEIEEIETEMMRSEGSMTVPEGTPLAENDMAMNEGNEPTEAAAEGISGDVPELNAGVTLLKWLADCRRQDDGFSQTSEMAETASLIDSLFPLTPLPAAQQLPPLQLEQLLPKYECRDCGRRCRSGAGLSSHMRGSKCPGKGAAVIAASPSLTQTQTQKPQPKPEQKASSLSSPQLQHQHQCPDCGLVCGSGAGLSSHMRGSKCPGKPLVPSAAAAAATVAASPRSLSPEPAAKTQQNSSSLQSQQQQLEPQPQLQQAQQCPDCGRICKSGAGLAAHRRGNLCPGKPGGSAIVTTSTTTSSHLMTTQPKPQPPPPPQQQQQQYQCPDCGRICESGAGLASHRRGSLCSGNSTNSSFSITGLGASRPSAVKQPSVQVPSPQSNFECPDCGRVCASGGGLASHMRGNQCPGRRGFTDNFSMSSRSSNVISIGGGGGGSWGGGGGVWYGGGGGGGGGYACPNCGRVCASGAGLASHMRGSRCS